ncbi:glycosyltransferase [Pseudomonas sp. RIT-PI-AD]|uniref:glycosyltransferase n=1 Tax=Pseudomonas sp. RIT-PI-AD TaxID=3035294 RepID=UPI0021D8F41D|nr:glycosyltransferase [Pseudomonas sp. RIT-PI-AD]
MANSPVVTPSPSQSTRALFAKRPNPYYIMAADYRRNSAGIRVLHMLCDALIRSGHEAYIYAQVMSPDLMTPRLTDLVVELHKTAGIEPIVVYPEVMDGNPLKANTVVRYLLNKPGFIEGSGVYDPDDLVFAYTKGLTQYGAKPENVLFLPAVDLRVFQPPQNPATRVRGKVCYYKGRRGHAEIDASLLPPDAVEITPQWPESWESLAALFQQCEYLYCGEASGLVLEAALCGCLGVIVPNPAAPHLIAPDETGMYGLAWGLEKAEIERARATLPLLREKLEAEARAFWPQLDHFIAVTQAAAAEFARYGHQLRFQRNLERWLASRTPNAEQTRLIERHLLPAGAEPRIGILLLADEGQAEALADTLRSLEEGRYRQVTLHLLAADGVDIPATSLPVRLHARQADTIASLNAAIAASDDQWLMVARAGDQFTPAGLQMLAVELTQAADCRAIFADEFHRGPDGFLGAAFRPAFNLDLLLSFPAAHARHWLFRRDVLDGLGGFDADFAGAAELDLLLRLVEQGGLVGLGHVDEVLLSTDAPLLADNPDERRAIERHLGARGYQAEVLSELPGRYRIDYRHADTPLVSILVSADRRLPVLRQCVESLLEKTGYPRFELLILEGGDADAEVRDWLAGIAGLGSDQVRVVGSASARSQPALLNLGAREALGDYLVLLESDSIIIHAHWLTQLINHGLRPEVGVVGGKVLSSDGRIQHAGLILGLNGPADRPFVGQPLETPGYMQRLQVDQDYTAVSAACLMVRRSVFDEVGGLDEALQYSQFDVDLCLRVREVGYLTVWTPHCVVVTDGGVSHEQSGAWSSEKREQVEREKGLMYSRWLPVLANDPAYNRNLSIVSSGFDFDHVRDRSWDPLPIAGLPRVLAYPADHFGCGHYRVIQPFKALQEAGLIQGQISDRYHSLVELERFQPDVLLLQRQIRDENLAAISEVRTFSRAFKVFELDDYLPNLPLKSVHRATMPKDIVKSLRRVIALTDRLVLSTEALAESFADLHGTIRVVANTLPVHWWGHLQSRRNVGDKPRIGWGGGASHTGDLELIFDVVRELADRVDWVFFGMCPDKLRPYVKEYHPGVSIDEYPAKLASLDLDLALAPLEQNLFNECKSNLRLLEYGACAYPVICSDVRCFRGDLPVTRVKNRFKDWMDAIQQHLADPEASAAQGRALRECVHRDWMLSGENLRRWQAAWLPD